jgi:hypothetical protein
MSESTDSTDNSIREMQSNQTKKQIYLYLIMIILGAINILLIYRMLTHKGKIF